MKRLILILLLCQPVLAQPVTPYYPFWIGHNGDGSNKGTMRAINVKDDAYGAKGDGVTDDTAAIDAAIAASHGAPVVFPVGTYIYSGTLAITADNVQLIGIGPTGEQTYYSPAGYAAELRITNVGVGNTGVLIGKAPGSSGAYIGQVLIENMRITVGTNCDIAVHLWHGKNCQFRNVAIYGNTDEDGSNNIGLKVSSGLHNLFENVTVLGDKNSDGTTSAVAASGYLQQALVCAVGYSSETITTTVFRHCYFGYSRVGVTATNVFVNFEDCTFETLYSRGVQIECITEHVNFTRCWWENVPDGAGYIDGSSPGAHVHISDSFISLYGGGSASMQDSFFYLRYGKLTVTNTRLSCTNTSGYHLILSGANVGGEALFAGCYFPNGTEPAVGRLLSIAGGGENSEWAKDQVTIMDHDGDVIFGQKRPFAVDNGATTAGYIDLYEDSDNGTNYLRLIGPASTDTDTLILPTAAEIAEAGYLYCAADGTITTDTPAGAGDMLAATYDVLVDGFVDGNDTAYGASWNGNVNAPSMNAVYDQIQLLGGDMTKAVYDVADDGFVDGNDTAYAASWNGNVNAPTMNAVYDQMQLLAGDMTKAVYDVADDGFVDGNDTAYAASWNGNIDAPSMNAVYDKVQALQPLDPNLTAIAGLTTAANQVIYWTGAGSAAMTSLTAFGRSIIDDDSEAVFKATVNLEIGTDVQAYDPNLTAIAGLTTAANKAIYWTGAGTAALYDLTAAGRAILDDATAANQATTLGLGTGDSPQFTGIELGHATDTTITRTGSGAIAVEGVGVSLSTHNHTGVYEPTDPNLTGIAAVDWTSGQFIRSSGSGNFAGVTANAGTDITADLEEEVTEGSLADSTIVSADIKDGEVAVADLAAAAKTAAVNFIIDGGGSAITTGIKGDFVIPFACTITGIAVLGDQSGSIVIDLWQGTIAEQNAGTIVDADSITAADPPTVSGAIGIDDDTLTGWDATVNALQVLRVNVDSCTSITRATLVLKLTKS